MRLVQKIVSGVAQANTGQTTVFNTPAGAQNVIFYLDVVAVAGTTPLTDLVIYHAVPKIVGAPVVATSTGGDGTHDEVQTVTLTGGPTDGTWSLTWPGVSADTNAALTGISATATAADVQAKFNAALPYGVGTYYGQDIVVTRSGSGTTGAPYVYTLTHSGATVDKLNVDAVTANGAALYTYAADTALGIGNGWDGITQIAGTTAGSVAIMVGPAVTGIADDDTGAIYALNTILPSKMAALITLDRTTGNETYTYSLYADWS